MKLNDIDIEREARTGIPEVVLAAHKDDDILLSAMERLLETGKALATRCSKEQMDILKDHFKGKVVIQGERSGTFAVFDDQRPEIVGKVHIIAAGSSDIPVAEECEITCRFLGLEVERSYDCGVAGLHRVMPAVDKLIIGWADAAIVIAGMEGTLPSVISGLVMQPVIAVPTSVGYGTGLDGAAAIMTMLNSCSPGISVMNIDNGFGAAVMAFKTISWIKRKDRDSVLNIHI